MDTSLKKALERIQANAPEVRSAATELTQQIKMFETWLGKVPGRVPVSLLLWTDEQGNEEYLAFRRHPKDWALVTFSSHVQSFDTSTPQLLRDAAIDTKANMMKHLPRLLEAMAKEQEAVAKRAREAAGDFKAFAQEIGIKEEA
jgi:hypothetical protein